MEQVPIAEPKPMFRLGKDEYLGLHKRYASLLTSPVCCDTIATFSKEEEIRQQLSSLFNGMMKALFNEKGSQLRIDILAEQPAQDFINAHADVLNSSFQQVTMSEAMRQRLQRSDYIFSGIKTFHELNEAFPSLLDSNGNRKPFEQFLNDVHKIDQTYNQNYLRAEYNFVQASATMAAKWEEFQQDGDRYNLQYRTANDDRVRPEHAALDRVTLPMSDPFWEEYYPPNGWNCRCTVVQVRKSKYPETPHDEAMSLGEAALQDSSPAGGGREGASIFHFNPGIQQKTVPDYNPYTIRRCRDCDIAKATVPDGSPSGSKLVFIPENELCAACRLIRQAQAQRLNQRPTAQEFGNVTSIAVEWAQNNLDTTLINGQPGKRTMVTTADGFTIGVGNKFFTETAHKNKRNPDLAHILKTATEFKKWLPNARRIPDNAIEPGRDHAFSFSVYTVEYQGRTIEFKCKLTDGELIYNMRFI